MEASFPLLFAAVVGFTHAFEADHLVAVGNIVTKRDRLALALKDGIYWGLGHTSTILLIGLLIIVGKATFLTSYVSSLEAVVGVMLIGLGCYRLYQYFRHDGELEHLLDHRHDHQLAYGVGLVHGLAGSGAMILLVMSNMEGALSSMSYLLIFGIGSVVGMLVAAGVLGLPLSKRLLDNRMLQVGLVLLSSLLCLGYGGFLLVEHL